MMNINASKEIKQNKRLLNKKDFLIIAGGHGLKTDNLKKMKISELREFFKLTHSIEGNFKDMRGFCFSCLKPLRPDYTRFENYCLDC